MDAVVLSIQHRAVPGLTRDLYETVQEVPGQARDIAAHG